MRSPDHRSRRRLGIGGTLCAVAMMTAPGAALAQSAQPVRTLPDRVVRPQPRLPQQQAEPAPTNVFVGDEYFNGIWSLAMTGTEFGSSLGNDAQVPFALRREPDGVYTGFSLDPQRPMRVFGRKVSSIEFRGVWMEMESISNLNPTGRWGLVRFIVSVPRREITGSFSISYRRPLTNFSDGYPGATVTGTYLHNAVDASTERNHNVRLVQANWRVLMTPRISSTHVRMLYPTAERSAALDRWMAGQTSDPCGASCLPAEPRHATFHLQHVSGNERGELSSEYYGEVGLRLSAVRGRGAPQPLGQWQFIYQVTRQNSDDDRVPFRIGIQPPEQYTYRCERDGAATARWRLPPGLWSDPMADIIVEHRGTIFEKDLARRTDDPMRARPVSSRFRETFDRGINDWRAPANRPCGIFYLPFAHAQRDQTATIQGFLVLE